MLECIQEFFSNINYGLLFTGFIAVGTVVTTLWMIISHVSSTKSQKKLNAGKFEFLVLPEERSDGAYRGTLAIKNKGNVGVNISRLRWYIYKSDVASFDAGKVQQGEIKDMTNLDLKADSEQSLESITIPVKQADHSYLIYKVDGTDKNSYSIKETKVYKFIQSNENLVLSPIVDNDFAQKAEALFEDD